MKMNKKGFTLIELLVVVLIIGILAAIALPQYFKAVERARASEALSIFTSIAGAQQRYYLVHDNDYGNNFGQLDLEFVDRDGNRVTAGSALSTRSFNITINTNGTITATRDAGRYAGYTLAKDVESGEVTCGGTNSTDICPALGL